MTIDNVYVTTRPNWGDVPMFFGYYWLSKVNEYAGIRGYEVVDLKGELALPDTFHSTLAERNPSFFHGVGHGNETLFSGQRITILMKACVNDEIMAERICYLMSCLTAIELGPSIISKGGRAYVGYNISFTWMDMHPPPGMPFDVSYLHYHWGWMDYSNALTNAILAGKTVSEAAVIAIEKVNAWIDFWSQSDDFNASSAIYWLVLDRDALTLLGDVNASIVPPSPETTHVRKAFRSGVHSRTVAPGDDLTFDIVCTCGVGTCDFRGRKLRLIDDYGVEQYNGVIENYLNGINWTRIVLPGVAPTPGVHDWTIIVEGDGLHPETTGHFWIRSVLKHNITVDSEPIKKIEFIIGPIEGYWKRHVTPWSDYVYEQEYRMEIPERLTVDGVVYIF
ncbi:unnamed protein product, partial [marine sediment metagenome]